MDMLQARGVDLVARRFSALGERQRLRMLLLLGSGEKTVGEVGEALQATQPSVSRHLRILLDAGILGRRRSGSSIYYCVADQVILKAFEMVWQSAIGIDRGTGESL
jgi:DNA-binding transcriptional ArsR family regulator